MERVALVAPGEKLRDALVRLADAGLVELDEPVTNEGAESGEAAQRLQRLSLHNAPARGAGSAVLTAAAPDLDALERAGRADVLAGEAQLETYAAGAVQRREVAAVAGWCAIDDMPDLSARLNEAGATLVPMPTPRSMDPPTLLGARGGIGSAFGTLVRTYGTVPYRDIDPTIWAGLAYVVMFGMMFGDVGHGMLLFLGAVLIRLGWIRRFPSLKPMWMFVAAAGTAAAMFGALYGEFFGPTGVVPVLWLAPLDDPLRLLLVALAIGAVLLGLAYTVGAVNRWREGGMRLALYAPSGIAGAVVFVGFGGVVAGLTIGPTVLVTIGAVVALAGRRAGPRRVVRRVGWRRVGGCAGRDRRIRPCCATRVQSGVVRPSGRLRHDARCVGLGGVARHDGTVGSRLGRDGGSRSGVRNRQCHRVRTGSIGGRSAGTAIGVLRVVFSGVHR